MKRLAALLAVALLISPATALSQESGDTSDRALLLILDASGSMGRVDVNGVRLIDGAKQALLDLVDILPDDVQVGLRVYGHTYPNTDKVNGCTDTELIVPVGPLDQGAMNDAIVSFDAKGFTPIGLSLDEAAGDFPPDVGTKAIVLVSDGEDTCAPPDPCEIARGLFEAGVIVRIETVGLVLDEAGARDQLQCIAEAAGGAYHDIGTIDILVQQLGSIADEAIGRPTPGPVPATPFALLLGGPTKAEATEFPTEFATTLEPGGQVENGYGFQLSPGDTLWYSIELEDLQLAGVGVNGFVAPAGATGYLDVRVFDEDGDEVAAGAGGVGERSLISGDTWAGVTMKQHPSGGRPELWPGTYYVRIMWDASPDDTVVEAVLGIFIEEMGGQEGADIRKAREETLQPESVETTTAPEAAVPQAGAPDADGDDGSGSLLPILVGAGVLALLGVGSWQWARHRR